ncbi:MAG TPA: SprT-like domain-containing protein [Pyrinomonadaceae bacterium]|nr:SprT-like domain-containing protein [Pyrinomonadaceae bacterium]
MSDLREYFADAFRNLGNGRGVPGIEIRFYPYAGLHHTIRIRSGRVYVRLSDICKNSPPEVLRSLAFMLVARLLGKRVPKLHDRIYRDYSLTPEVMRSSDIARRRRGRKLLSSAQGEVYDLEKMFAKLNRRYFGNELPKPTITWSQRRTRNILGHHDRVYDSITISKTLDSPEVPEWFVEYILYHEMLHIKHPARLINGRRYYHTSAFRLDERRFPYYEEAQQWLERIARLRRVPRTRAA